MYRPYFGLAESPFSIAPDPRFLYLSQRHQEALAHLLYGLKGDGGFVLLTGEVGSGKTTICRRLLEQVPEHCDVAYIFNPRLSVDELLATFCREIGIALPDGTCSIKTYVDAINEHLLQAHAAGRNTVLIIDEAQNLAADVLEQMRLLTNLETERRKLLQIVLIGQPELATLLERPELRQLSQRVVARYHLEALSRNEVAAYVRHRLEIAGATAPLIPETLMGRLYRLSGGVPRLVNLLCDRALLGAYAQGKSHVDAATLRQAAREVLPGGRGRPSQRSQRRSGPLLRLDGMKWPLRIAGGLFGLAGVGLLALAVSRYGFQGAGQEPAALATPPAVAQAPDLPASLAAPGEAGRGSEAAYADLFRTWGLAYRPGRDFCQQARAAGLRCFNGRGKAEALRAQGLPAVLTLRAAKSVGAEGKGGEFAATLVGLDAGQAEFLVQGERRRVALAVLEKQWNGHYTLLWQRPKAVRGDLQAGERGPAANWLAARLANWQGKTWPNGAEAAFDETLVSELKRFQRAQGLAADGAPGAQTLMRLAALEPRAAGDRRPTLALGAEVEPAMPPTTVPDGSTAPALELKVAPMLESIRGGRR